jgi:hypothetical protein
MAVTVPEFRLLILKTDRSGAHNELCFDTVFFSCINLSMVNTIDDSIKGNPLGSVGLM